MQNYLNSRKILTYDDVVKFPGGNSIEPLVDLRKYDHSIVDKYIKHDMLSYTGDVMYVRDSLAKKLASINANLKPMGYHLNVAYGYRHPDIQKEYFIKRRDAIRLQFPTYSDDELDRYTHNFVAVPDIAGHPAGAAVDVTIVTAEGNELDMGTGIAEYHDPNKIKTFAIGLTTDQVRNRTLLHDLMIDEGFAPFYGEWWHFSYGDREWAAFYNKKALFSAIDFRG